MNTLYDVIILLIGIAIYLYICVYYVCLLLSCCVSTLFTPVNIAAPIRCSPANCINLSQCPNENSRDDCS